jgi:hypothetical protein
MHKAFLRLPKHLQTLYPQHPAFPVLGCHACLLHTFRTFRPQMHMLLCTLGLGVDVADAPPSCRCRMVGGGDARGTCFLSSSVGVRVQGPGTMC